MESPDGEPNQGEGGEFARELIMDKFKEVGSLEHIGELRTEYVRKQAVAASQLSSSVHVRLDSVKRARDLITESTQHVMDIKQRVQEMDKLASNCRGLFEKYPHIKCLHRARKNLAITENLLEYSYAIPEKARELIKLLSEHKDQIKYIATETSMLEDWREGVMHSLKVYREKVMNPITSSESSNEMDSARKYQCIVKQLGLQLSLTLELSEAIRNHILHTVSGTFDSNGKLVEGGCFPLALANPSLLIATLEAYELLHEGVNRRWKEAKRLAIEGGEDLDIALAGFDSPERLNEKLMAAIEKHILTRITAEFSSSQMAAVDSGKSKLNATLGAATSLLLDLKVINERVAPCFPSRYDILAFFRGVYEQFLKDLLLPLVATEDRMFEYEVVDILEAIKWLQYYSEQETEVPEFVQAMSVLKSTYLIRIKGQINEWIGNLRSNQGNKPVQYNDGTWHTPYPDDIFNLIHVQINVAKSLPVAFLGDVLVALLDALHIGQMAESTYIDTKWRTIAQQDNGLEQLCSIVNDDLRMQEKIGNLCDEVNEAMQPHDCTYLNNKMDEVMTQYVTGALLATNKIDLYIFDTLTGAGTLVELFTPHWVNGELETASTIVDTYIDFFGDLQDWLPNFFFAKLVRSCYEHTFIKYVNALLYPKRSLFDCARVASRQGMADVKYITKTYLPHKMKDDTLGELLTQAGIARDALEAPSMMLMDILTILGAVDMEALQFSSTQAATKRVISEFKSQGVDFIMSVLNLQKRWSGEEKTARLEFIKRLSNTCGSFHSNEKSELYQFDNLHDSSSGHRISKALRGELYKRKSTKKTTSITALSEFDHKGESQLRQSSSWGNEK
eukprot:458648_1